MKTRRACSVAVLLAATLTAGCAQTPESGGPSAAASDSMVSGAPSTGVAPTPSVAVSGPETSGPETSPLFDDTRVHEVSISFDQGSYDSLIQAYTTTGEKKWIEATVTIDGATYESVGIRLKGNSSLRGLGSTNRGGPGGDLSSAEPESLPWLVDLDRFVDGQAHEGVAEFVVRSNSSATALNEAVALELLAESGLPSQDAIPVRFSVNGGTQVLRLVIENPEDTWMADELNAGGALYKAESSGNYSYRGSDPAAYEEVFDQEAGQDNADMTPLIEFLEFINNAADATFASEIESRLDVDSFATYLAMQDLLENFDDIDGPGNNSYLFYDTETGQMTVVPWDHNLAFGIGPGGGGRGGFDGGGGGGRGGFDGGGGGFPGRSNVLVERFLDIAEYQAMVDAKQESLSEELFDSGTAASILDRWVDVLETGAADLVDSATIRSEADQIEKSF
ncbi:MAG: CotH kinase family protein [Aeromicrobium sp.]